MHAYHPIQRVLMCTVALWISKALLNTLPSGFGATKTSTYIQLIRGNVDRYTYTVIIYQQFTVVDDWIRKGELSKASTDHLGEFTPASEHLMNCLGEVRREVNLHRGRAKKEKKEGPTYIKRGKNPLQ